MYRQNNCLATRERNFWKKPSKFLYRNGSGESTGANAKYDYGTVAYDTAVTGR